MDIEDVVVNLCCGNQIVLGRTYSVGPYTPAVPDPDGYAWAVMGRGGPAVLAFDAFEAARWFLMAEQGQLEGCEGPIRLSANVSGGDEALRYWFSICDMWLETRRRSLSTRRSA